MIYISRPHRNGTVLICVLACLIVVTALIGSVTQTALRGRQAARIQKDLRQTELLCEAGVLRAIQRLKQSPDYGGEQWRPHFNSPEQAAGSAQPPGDASPSADATVDIRVAMAEEPSARTVEVIAHFDSHITSAGVLQRSHRFTFEIPATPSAENQ